MGYYYAGYVIGFLTGVCLAAHFWRKRGKLKGKLPIVVHRKIGFIGRSYYRETQSGVQVVGVLKWHGEWVVYAILCQPDGTVHMMDSPDNQKCRSAAKLQARLDRWAKWTGLQEVPQ